MIYSIFKYKIKDYKLMPSDIGEVYQNKRGSKTGVFNRTGFYRGALPTNTGYNYLAPEYYTAANTRMGDGSGSRTGIRNDSIGTLFGNSKYSGRSRKKSSNDDDYSRGSTKRHARKSTSRNRYKAFFG